jgi:tetratricopeptide (TPR) repeat protein
MNELQKRAALYGIGIAIVGGLGFAMANSRAEADVATLLSSADVQLRLAYGIPARDLQGQELDTRSRMVADSVANLEIVERLEPGLAVTAEFRGFAHMLRGEFREAAALYARAQACKDCGDEQRDVLAFNQARMLAQAGDHDRALAVFAQHAQRLDTRFGHQRRIEEAGILLAAGRQAEATARVESVFADATAEPHARLQAAELALRLHLDGKAESVLADLAAQVPIADYSRALLKLRQGDADTGMQLLERAAQAVPAEVRRRIETDPDAWRAVSGDARFQQVYAPRAATPGR